MGKSGRAKRPNERWDPTRNRSKLDVEGRLFRESKVLPVLKSLKSSEAQTRSLAIREIAKLIENENHRNLLLQDNVVHIIMEHIITVPTLDVSIPGWGVLYNLTLAEGSSFARHLYEEDIITPLQDALQHVGRTTNVGFDSFAEFQSGSCFS